MLSLSPGRASWWMEAKEIQDSDQQGSDQKDTSTRAQGLTPVIPATQEAEIGRLEL
jgi:hypothetical protein